MALPWDRHQSLQVGWLAGRLTSRRLSLHFPFYPSSTSVCRLQLYHAFHLCTPPSFLSLPHHIYRRNARSRRTAGL
ncbi:hypothetical protein BC567DRAFT_236382 [Phyllosticta citribraziliensis]